MIMNISKNNFWVFSIIFILTIAYSCKKTTDNNTKTTFMITQNNDIQELVEVLINIDSVTTNGYTTPTLVFTIKNHDSVPIKLIKRLSIGYENTDNREVYLLITKNDSEENIANNAVLYSREKATEDDFEWLQPGQSFKANFVLQEWYKLPKESFNIQAVYDPTESVSLDDSLAKEKYYSNKIFISND